MLAQRLGHQPEPAREQIHFHRRGRRQRHFEIALADVIGRFGQRLDGRTKASGNPVGSNEPDDQHSQPDQPEQARNQQRPVAGRVLHRINVVERLLMLGDQAIAQSVEAFTKVTVATQRQTRVTGLIKHLKKLKIIGFGLREPVLPAIAFLFLSNAFVK